MHEQTIGSGKHHEGKAEGSLDARIAAMPENQRKGLAVLYEFLGQEGSNAFDSFQITDTGDLALAEGVSPATPTEELFKQGFEAKRAA